MTSREEQNAILRALKNGDARSVHNTSDSVSEYMCHKWRTNLHHAAINDLAVSWPRDTIIKHVTGECDHPTTPNGWPVKKVDGEWMRVRVVSANQPLHNVDIYHTRHCRYVPDRIRVFPDGERGRRWRECRECSGHVPESQPL